MLLLALFVRFQAPDAAARPRHLQATRDELLVVRRHHRVFYALLIVAPLEWWLRGRPAASFQLAGAALFLAGVVGYRVTGRALGGQLSPLLSPREPATLVDHGPYRWLRHPMYLAEVAMALGAALTLAAVSASVLAGVFLVLVIRRIAIEERMLAAGIPGYRAYAARTYRLVPYVY